MNFFKENVNSEATLKRYCINLMGSFMSDSINSLPEDSFQSDQTTSQQDFERTGESVTDLSSELTPAEQHKASLNVSILESAAVIIGVKEDPLALVLSSAIERINEFLAPVLGENSIQKAADSRLDVSPEATAERIVGLSTVFYGEFKAQHPGKDEESLLTNFVDNIYSSIKKGFAEARDILEGLDVLEGGIANNIDLTFELIQEKLAVFESIIRERDGLSVGDV